MIALRVAAPYTLSIYQRPWPPRFPLRHGQHHHVAPPKAAPPSLPFCPQLKQEEAFRGRRKV